MIAVLLPLLFFHQEAPGVSSPQNRERAPLPPIPEIRALPGLLSRASATITVIQGDELGTLGIRFLTDGFRLAPGLEVDRISSTESNVSVRSYNAQASAAQGILGLVDGRQVYNEFLGSVIWETLPVTVDQIQRVEIVRGPASFVYGPNAMHGLINIVTKSPLEYTKDELFFHGYAGSYRSNLETLTYVRREENTAVKTTLAHDDISEFEPRSRNTKDKVFMEVRLESLLDGKDQRLDVAGGTSKQKFDVLIPAFSAVPTTEFFNEAQESFARAAYSYRDLVKLNVSWTHFDSTSAPEPVGNYTGFDLLMDHADIDLQSNFRVLEFNKVTAGTGYRYSTFVTHDQDVSDGRHQTGLEWLFIQDEVDLDHTLLLTAGVRWDHHSISGNSVSPRLAAVWTIDEGPPPEPGKNPPGGHYLRATAGYGFRNPSLRELWLDMPVLGGLGTIVGNLDLKPEKMRSFEIGYWGRPTPSFQLESSVYYNLIDRLAEWVASPTPGVFHPENRENDRAYGIETEAEIQLTRELFGFANYAFEVREDRDTHERKHEGPRHKANGGARMTLDSWSAMVWATFFDDIEFVDPTTNRSTGTARQYTLLNAQIAYRLKWGRTQGKAFVQAFNLLDHDHREHPQGDSYGMIAVAGFELTW